MSFMSIAHATRLGKRRFRYSHPQAPALAPMHRPSATPCSGSGRGHEGHWRGSLRSASKAARPAYRRARRWRVPIRLGTGSQNLVRPRALRVPTCAADGCRVQSGPVADSPGQDRPSGARCATDNHQEHGLADCRPAHVHFPLSLSFMRAVRFPSSGE